MQLLILTTGGTIDKINYAIGDPQIGNVLQESNVAFRFLVRPLFRKDSLEITPQDRGVILETVRAAPHERILITHGTDTMADTARALIGITGKTIVLVGSMAPARFRTTDAVFNIGYALHAVQSLDPGVYIAMNGKVFDPRVTKKDRTQRRFIEVP